MSTTVHVKGISHETSEKEVKDFFSFWYESQFYMLCYKTDAFYSGKITNISVTPESDAANASKTASVTFEKET
jgi:hypothetical protein